MRITIKDIARLAGVSRGTVDRALNDRGNIDPKKKQKILEIAREHGYVKNIYASNLAQGTSLLVIIVLPDPGSDPFWEAPRMGIDKTANFVKSYGITLKYYDFDLFDKESFCSCLDQAINDKPQAILTAPLYQKEFRKYLQIAEQNDIPFVCINSEIDDRGVMAYIGQDSYQCGQLAGRLFEMTIGKNKNIAVISLGKDVKNAVHIEQKILGLQDFNEKNEQENEINFFQLTEFKEKDKIKLFAEQLLSENSAPHGIFFTNSRAYHFLNSSAGLAHVVDDKTIIGFDLLPQNIQLLEDERIDFLLNQGPARQAYLGLISIFNYFIFNKKIDSKIYLPIDVVVKENYRNYLSNSSSEMELAS